MAIERDEALIHWNYFLAIEEDLARLARFVDFSANDTTFSIEIARLYLSASSEVDVVLKQLCKKLDTNSEAASINNYYEVISQYLPRFKNFEAITPQYGLSLNPWSSWSSGEPPIWWRDHNKVKHHRHRYFEKANLKNCLNETVHNSVST